MFLALWELSELGEDNPLFHGDSQRPMILYPSLNPQYGEI